MNQALKISHQTQSSSKFFEPFQKGSYVVQFETLKDTKWVHFFHDQHRMEGSWVMKYNSIKGFTLEEVSHKYAIPNKINSMVEVHVPKGSQMTRGMVEYQHFDGKLPLEGKSGSVQHILKDYDKRWFLNPKKIEGRIP